MTRGRLEHEQARSDPAGREVAREALIPRPLRSAASPEAPRFQPDMRKTGAMNTATISSAPRAQRNGWRITRCAQRPQNAPRTGARARARGQFTRAPNPASSAGSRVSVASTAVMTTTTPPNTSALRNGSRTSNSARNPIATAAPEHTIVRRTSCTARRAASCAVRALASARRKAPTSSSA